MYGSSVKEHKKGTSIGTVWLDKFMYQPQDAVMWKNA